MAVAELLDAALRQRGVRGSRVEARQALEAALDHRAGVLCIVVTESGGTRATILAVESARGTEATPADIAHAAPHVAAEPQATRVCWALHEWSYTARDSGAASLDPYSELPTEAT